MRSIKFDDTDGEKDEKDFHFKIWECRVMFFFWSMKFVGWTAFEFGFLGALAQHAFVWTNYIFRTDVCMMILPTLDAARLVIAVVTCTPILLAVMEAHSWFFVWFFHLDNWVQWHWQIENIAVIIIWYEIHE